LNLGRRGPHGTGCGAAMPAEKRQHYRHRSDERQYAQVHGTE
jgi:hypothetical protein